VSFVSTCPPPRKKPSKEKTCPNFFFQFSDPQAQLPNRCLHFISQYDDVNIASLHTYAQCIELLIISLKYPKLERNAHCENVRHVLGFALLKTALLLLASCKHETRFLFTANENQSEAGVTDTVPTFPQIILQKICFSMDESLCSLQF
jgi:hypothetical protein